MAELHDLTALEQGRLIASRQVSSAELATYYLERCDRLSAEVGGFVVMTPETALAQAAHADSLVAQGEVRGPLFGVVTPVKGLSMVAGHRAQLGSAAVDFIAPYTDHVVLAMQQAGLVMTGFTTAPEFGLPCYTEPAIAPAARTPWDLTRSAGGSSGGAAASVAAGLAPVAHGSDGGGSIRIPASVCGLVGLKPSRGRVSSGPLAESVGELGVHGPIARTVADAAALLDVMSVRFPGDPGFGAHPEESFLSAVGAPLKSLRIGRFSQPTVPGSFVDPEVLAELDSTSRLLESMGHEIVDIDTPFDPSILPLFLTLWSVMSTGVPVPAEREADVRPLSRWLRDRGRSVTGPELAGAVFALRSAARRALAIMSAFDVVLTPTLAHLPAEIGKLRNDADPAEDFAAQSRFTPFTAFFNLTGQPAVSLPMGWSTSGLPIGMQLVAPVGREALLIALASSVESARPWSHLHPPMWDR